MSFLAAKSTPSKEEILTLKAEIVPLEIEMGHALKALEEAQRWVGIIGLHIGWSCWPRIYRPT